MNNQFEYDKNGVPAPKVQSARQLSNGQWYVNGRIVEPSELTKEQKQQAEKLQAVHDARLNNAPADIKRRALKKLKECLKSINKTEKQS